MVSAAGRPVFGLAGGRVWIPIRARWPIVVVLLLVAVVRLVVRFRVELISGTLAYLACSWLAERVGGWQHLALITAGLLLLGLAHPWTRRRIIGRWWVLFTRHRIRTALAQAGVASAEGRVPTVVRTTPSPVGTRVRVWMPAGTAVEQLGQDESVRMGIVRTACWAREVRMERDPRWPQIALFHLVRYDTLAPTVSVRSTLPGLLARVGNAVDAVGAVGTAPGRLALIGQSARRRLVAVLVAGLAWLPRPRRSGATPQPSGSTPARVDGVAGVQR